MCFVFLGVLGSVCCLFFQYGLIRFRFLLMQRFGRVCWRRGGPESLHRGWVIIICDTTCPPLS